MFWGTRPRIHLIGIGGSGMSGIAEVLLASGFSVSGSDLSQSNITERLKSLGARIFQGHRAENIDRATCVVVSSAVARDNPEWKAAEKQGIPVIARAEMLAELMRLKMGIAIAGSHGKTTTTSLLGQILRPLDPTVVVGGRLQHWNASSIVGAGSAFVIEADESDRSFLKFSPVYSIVTNIDREHLDTYRDLADVQQTFLEFLNRTAFFGMNWICADCPELIEIQSRIHKPTKTYGYHKEADLRITSFELHERSSSFRLEFEGRELGEFKLPVVGKHNIQNAAAAIGVAISLNLSIADIQSACAKFVPADRRLQIHFENEGLSVVEDYGHHPTEIAATLDAFQLMYPDRRRVVVFQPHRYTRTQALWNDFASSFGARCDLLALLPIYAAHEKPIDGVSSVALAKTFTSLHVQLFDSTPSAEEIWNLFQLQTERSTAVLVLGAGPLTKLAQDLSALATKKTSASIDAQQNDSVRSISAKI